MDKGTWKVTPDYAVTVRGGNALNALLDPDYSVPAGPVMGLVLAYEWGSSGFGRPDGGKGMTRWSVLEYKHYHPTKGKFWTAKPGKEQLFLVPLTAIRLVPPPADRHGWGSYPRVEIGGAEIILSVTGGSGGPAGCWTDWIGEYASTKVNLTGRAHRAVSDAAVPQAAKPVGLDCRPEDAENTWLRLRRLLAERIGPKGLKPGDPFELAKYCRLPDGTTRGTAGSINPRRRECTTEDRYPVRVKYSQIDWVKTCELVGFKYPEDFPPKPEPQQEPAMKHG